MKGDKRALSYGAPAAVKIHAGMRMFELYTEMAKQKLTAMGGADPHVGIGGWVTGAGHGPLTSIYGLGADQVIEMEVVTADGEYRVVNEKTYPDLFWAIRGVSVFLSCSELVLTKIRAGAQRSAFCCQSRSKHMLQHKSWRSCTHTTPPQIPKPSGPSQPTSISRSRESTTLAAWDTTS